MQRVITNPGAGPVEGECTSEAATRNMEELLADVLEILGSEATLSFDSVPRDPKHHDGRYRFEVRRERDNGSWSFVVVDMPGLPLDLVRYGEGKNPWNFPRIMVNESSWLWPWAVSQCVSRLR